MLNWKNTATILDGAMGTMLQQAGVTQERVPEVINLTNPDLVLNIHRQYLEAGAQILYANTFGANRYKLAGCEHTVRDLIGSGIRIAKNAAKGSSALVALDAGPIGTLLEPNGSLSFEDAYDIYREMVLCAAEAGADLLVFETITDLLEMKAALLAAKESCDLPVFCSMSFEKGGRTFTGVSIPCMAVTLEGLGADAVGINCSLGPHEIYPMAKELSQWTSLPLLIKPNAGLPDCNSNQYNIDAAEFASSMARFLDLGVTIVGGCCGTTPEYIRALRQACQTVSITQRTPVRRSVLCSASRMVPIDTVRVVGERINPTGKKLFQEALRKRDYGYIMKQAIDQIQAGADVLDVNVGLPGVDERELMTQTVKQLQAVTDVPLQLDSSNAEVLESALRVTNGKPLVNSVNGEKAVLDRILPLVKRYGAAVIGLTLNEKGIPLKAEDRFQIAKDIVDSALSYGIPLADIYIDCLTLTASVQQAEVQETLKAMRMVKEQLGVKTVLGVSNISFGLPEREIINTSFLTLALAHGLDLPILNPNNKAMMNAIDAFLVLYNQDSGARRYLQRHSNQTVQSKQKPSEAKNSAEDLFFFVENGLKDEVRNTVQVLLQTTAPMDLVNTQLIPALDRVGAQFEAGKLFLPQLIQSATAAQAGFEEIKRVLSSQKNPASVSKGKIVLATVKGDIHDIGKNIVKVILENYGYDIYDLGRDVPIETVVSEVKRTGAKLVGLSALMTTTVINMEKTIAALRAETDCTILVGGAVLTESYAKQIGADYYAKDAKASADIARKVLG